MSAALTGPFLVAAGLLCVSGAAKLRAPRPAARALATALGGRRVAPALVRVLSAVELAVGAAAALAGGRAMAATLACLYAAFALLAGALARRRLACGCFGEAGTPVTRGHALLSTGLAAGCALAALWPAHGLGWVLGHPAPTALALAVGCAGCVYALVIAYTQLPAAWAAWSPR